MFEKKKLTSLIGSFRIGPLSFKTAILLAESFVKDYESYENNMDVDKLRNFFDDIETNKNYFRLNVKKSRKYINKNNDTDIIKHINSNMQNPYTLIDQAIPGAGDISKQNIELLQTKQVCGCCDYCSIIFHIRTEILTMNTGTIMDNSSLQLQYCSNKCLMDDTKRSSILKNITFMKHICT